MGDQDAGSPPGDPKATAKAFCQALWGEAKGWIEFRPIGPDGKTYQLWFEYPDKLGAFLLGALGESGKKHVYFSVCLRSRRGGSHKADIGVVTCLWTDIDFKTVSEAETKKTIEEFPLQPSLVVQSGNGWHVYWLLKEPITDKALFPRVEATNRAIAELVRGDHTHDLARILRLPGSLNIKYMPPRLAEVIASHPERVYGLVDFEQYLEIKEQEALPTTPVPPPPSTTGLPPVEVESLSIDDACKRVIKEGKPAYIAYRRAKDSPDKFKERQKKGLLSRSEADAWCIPQLIKAGLPDDQIYAIWRDPRNRVGEKYRTHKSPDQYLGRTIQRAHRWNERYPNALDRGAEIIGRALDREFPDEDEAVDLKVIKRVKHDTRKAEWTTTIETQGNQYTVRSDTSVQLNPRKFFELMYEEHNIGIPHLTEDRWEKMVLDSPLEIQSPNSPEATPAGYMKQLIEDYESLSRPEATSSEAVLKVAPIKTDTGEILIRLPSLLTFLRREGVEESRRAAVILALHELGYEASARRRVGDTQFRVWVKPALSQPGGASKPPNSNGFSGEHP